MLPIFKNASATAHKTWLKSSYTTKKVGFLIARRSPTRRQPAYSTIDVLLSTEVGMVQAPIGTTRVRASGVLSHPLASERGELPLLGPRQAAPLPLRRLRRATHR